MIDGEKKVQAKLENEFAALHPDDSKVEALVQKIELDSMIENGHLIWIRMYFEIS